MAVQDVKGSIVLPGSSVPGFLSKLWLLVDDAENDELIGWSQVSLGKICRLDSNVDRLNKKSCLNCHYRVYFNVLFNSISISTDIKFEMRLYRSLSAVGSAGNWKIQHELQFKIKKNSCF